MLFFSDDEDDDDVVTPKPPIEHEEEKIFKKDEENDSKGILKNFTLKKLCRFLIRFSLLFIYESRIKCSKLKRCIWL